MMPDMATADSDRFDELRISLEHLIVVQSDDGDQYDDNYVRHISGPVFLVHGEREEETKIGEVELIYFAGSRAVENGLDIVDVSDSVGQEEYEYAKAVYTGGVLDREIVEEPMSNDLLAIHSVALSAEYRRYVPRVVGKIGGTIGYHCGAVVMGNDDVEPDVVAETAPGYLQPYQLAPTKNSSIQIIIFS